MKFRKIAILMLFAVPLSATPLIDAIKKGDTQTALNLIVSNASLVHAKDEVGNMPLGYAIHANQAGVMKALINKGAELNGLHSFVMYSFQDNKPTAVIPQDYYLHFALKEQNLEAFQILLDAQADPYKKGYFDADLISTMMTNDNYLPFVKALASRIDVASLKKNRPGLPFEATLEVMQYLIKDLHYDVNSKDKYGNTLLHYHCERDFVRAVKLLLSLEANTQIKNNRGEDALAYAKRNNNRGYVTRSIESLENFIKTGELVINTPIDESLHNAVMSGNYWEVKKLLKNPGQRKFINSISEYCESPLSLSFKDGTASERKVGEDTALLLLQNGANPHLVTGSSEDTALHLASRYEYMRVLKYLFTNASKLKINANVKNRLGETPLIAAAASMTRPEVINVLLKYKASVHEQDANGKGVLHHLREHEAMESKVSILLKAGADINLKDKRGLTPLMLHSSPFQNSSVAMVKLLLKNGADFKAMDNGGNTVLHWAVLSYTAELMTNFWITKKELINARNFADKTPLGVAKDGRSKIDFPDTRNETPDEVIDLLIRNGAQI